MAHLLPHTSVFAMPLIMKGILIFTEGRSGSNWLGSLLKNTGTMGKPNEWLDRALLGSKPKDFQAYVDEIVAKASTENGRFAVKLFPRHLRLAHAEYGVDFVREIRTRHDIGMIRLSRRDRMLQAMSYARGLMTSQWTSRNEAKTQAVYDFRAICEAYFYIERSEAFWNSYLELNGFRPRQFFYEELTADPAPFVEEAARMLDVAPPREVRTDLKVQRDALTEEWIARFREDLARSSPLPYANGRPASRTVHNLRRFFKRKPLAPF